MPTYPRTIPDVRDAMLPYELPTPPAEGDDPLAEARLVLADAQGRASPVVAVVMVFDALKGHIDALDEEGLRLLAGCGHLIATNAWHGKGEEAINVRDQAVAALTAMEA